MRSSCLLLLALALPIRARLILPSEPPRGFNSAVYLDVFTNESCTGTPNVSVELSAANASYVHCTQCWDRCAAGVSASSLRLRGPPNLVAALNINCIGAFQYQGGWTDAAFGGTLSTGAGTGACHEGGASAVVLCDGTAETLSSA